MSTLSHGSAVGMRERYIVIGQSEWEFLRQRIFDLAMTMNKTWSPTPCETHPDKCWVWSDVHWEMITPVPSTSTQPGSMWGDSYSITPQSCDGMWCSWREPSTLSPAGTSELMPSLSTAAISQMLSDSSSTEWTPRWSTPLTTTTMLATRPIWRPRTPSGTAGW